MKTTLLILLIIFFCSCSNKKTDNSGSKDSVIRIDLFSEPKSTVTKLSEFATNVEYIPLQTNENSLLWEFVIKIVHTDNRIFIQNGGLGGEIMCFDMAGKYLFKLDNRGRGPEEYTNIMDFDVSSDNKILTILSTMNRKLVTYGITDTGFVFQRSLTLNDPVPWKIGLVPETDFAFLVVNPWNRTAPTLSLLINTNGDTIYFKPNSYGKRQDRESRAMASGTTLVYKVDNRVCFREFYSDTIFCVDVKDNSFKPRIILDTHGTLPTPEMVGHPEIGGDKTTMIDGIYETPRYTFINYRDGPEDYNCILFDKTTKTKHNLEIGTFNVTTDFSSYNEGRLKLKDDLSGGPDFIQNFQDLSIINSGGKLFSLVDAIALKKYIASEDFKKAKPSDAKKKKALETLANSLKDTDNPVLMMVTLKD